MPNENYTTIWIPQELKDELHARKSHPRQAYWEVIRDALEGAGAEADVEGRV